MPKSKNRKEHKEKLTNYKNNKKMSQENQLPQPEKIRQVPVWKSTAQIEMNGLEFEAIFNFINSVQGAYGAVQSIMQKNILKGNVDIDFEKLNEDQTAYVPMTDEEKTPHKAELQVMLANLKDQAAKMVRREDLDQEPDSQEGLPRIDALVDANGSPISS